MPLKNIPLRVFRDYLKYQGLRLIKTEGGHEKWWKEGLLRPVILQTHIDPIREFILKNNLATMGSTKKEFEQWLDPIKKERNKK